MKNKYLIIIILLFTTTNGYSQKFGIGFQSGVGSYSMSGLDNLNSYVINILPFDGKLVSNFPNYWYYKPSISLNFNKGCVGIVSTFQSTGSRVSAKDYSGEYRFDLKVKSHNPGIFGEIALLTKEKMQFSISSIVGLTYSYMIIDEYAIVYNEKLKNERIGYKALNYYFEPGLNFYYKVYFLLIGINGGYFFQFGDQGYYTGVNKNNTLLNPDTYSYITPDWNGFRAGLSLRYILNLKKI